MCGCGVIRRQYVDEFVTDIERSNSSRGMGDFPHVDEASLFRDDPMLSEDFKLRSGSPCIDAGTALFERGARISFQLPSEAYSGVSPDLGAFEFASGDRSD
jgi:hypothetical protein